MGGSRKDGERGDDGEQGECDEAKAVQDLGRGDGIIKLKYVESESGPSPREDDSWKGN